MVQRPFGPLAVGAVVLTCALALALRLSTLDTSPNYDSLATLQETDATTPALLADYFSLRTAASVTGNTAEIAHQINVTFPGSYVVNRAWMAVTGQAGYRGLRLLMALLSFGTVVIIALLAWHMVGPHGAVAGSILATFSPLLQYYGSYIRFYATVTFFAALAYAVTLVVVSDGGRAHRYRSHPMVLVMLCVLAWLPLTMHASGAIPLFVCSYLLFFRLWPTLAPVRRVWLAAIYAICGAPVLVNALAFVFARASDGSARSLRNSMSTSVTSLGASLAVNFNGLLFVLILFVICVFWRRLRISLLYVPFLICLSGASLLIAVRNDLFRPDYFSTLLPIVYFLCADGLEAMVVGLGDGWGSRSVAYLVLGLAVSFTLPSFVSNAFIDQDGNDFVAAIADVKVLEPGRSVLVFSDLPGYFPRDSDGRVTVVAHAMDESSYAAVMYIVGWRREGFGKNFYMNGEADPAAAQRRVAEILDKSRLRKISGRPRLDMRDNLLFIFQRAPTVAARTPSGSAPDPSTPE